MAASSPIKKIGCCTSCDKEVYEIISKYPHDHYLAGESKQVGKRLSIARTKTFILTDGSTMDLTYCDKCQPDLLKDWKKVMNSWQRELDPEYRKSLNLEEANDKTKAWFYLMTKTIPVAING